MNLSKHDALRKLLAHPQHLTILKRLKKDLRQSIKDTDLLLLTKDEDCQTIADNINAAYKKLTEVQKKALFPDKAEYNVLISTETIYSWARNTGSISNAKTKLLQVFLGEWEPPTETEITDTEDHAAKVNDGDIRYLVNQRFWGYNRMTGTEKTATRRSENFENIEDCVIQSLIIFEKFNPKSKRIEVRRTTDWQTYQGHAYLRNGIMYLDLDLQNEPSAERSNYIGRVEDLRKLTDIKFIRICLDFEQKDPIATRSMLIPIDNNDTEQPKIMDRFVRLSEINPAHRKRVNDYLGDASNVVLRTTPLSKNDSIARADSLIMHIDKRWRHILDDFFQMHIEFVKTGISYNAIEFEIVGMSMLDEFFSKVVNKMPDDAVLCATSFASSAYFWKNYTINRLENATRNFVERGGTMQRFFFVNNLDKNELVPDQMRVLIEHYKVYGKVANNESGIFLVNQLRIIAPFRKFIVTEQSKGLISWELSVERKFDDITGRATDIRITTSKDIHQNYAEKFKFFIDCMKQPNNTTVRRVTDDDIAFWTEKLSGDSK